MTKGGALREVCGRRNEQYILGPGSLLRTGIQGCLAANASKARFLFVIFEKIVDRTPTIPLVGKTRVSTW